MDEEFALEVTDLTVSYHGKLALQGVTLAVEKGALVGIIGPNGAGKSTFLKAVLDLIPKESGQIALSGKPFREQRERTAYVPQRNQLDWDFPIDVFGTVLLGTYPGLKPFRKPGRAEKERAVHALEKVGMADFRARQIGELSGGQQQRVFLARALAQQPDILFLDEPFVGIDASSEDNIMAILRELRDEGKTVFVVHHDLSKISSYFEKVIVLNKQLAGCCDVRQAIQSGLLNRVYSGQHVIAEQAGGRMNGIL